MSRVQGRVRSRKRINNPASLKSSEAPLQTQSPIVLNPEIMGCTSNPIEDVVDNDNCIVIESDEDEVEITSAMYSADDSVICLGSVVTFQSPFSPSEGIEVISENIKHRGNSYQHSLPSILPPVFIVNQSPSRLQPTIDCSQVITTTTASSSLYSHNNSVPSYVTNESHESDSTVKCPICFDDSKTIQQSNKQLVVTVCGHVYCKNCLEDVLKVNKQCPKCRKRLGKKPYHPLYL